MKILVASHGGLSKEFVETTQMITGSTDNIIFLGLETGESIATFQDDIEKLLTEDKEIKFILVDLVGGSPMMASALAIESTKRNDVTLVGGINLSLLLELSQVHLHGTQWDIEDIVNMARESIKIIRKGD